MFRLSIIGLASFLFIGCGGSQSGGSDNSDSNSNSTTQNSQVTSYINITTTTPKLNKTQLDVINSHNKKRNIYFHDSNLKYSLKLEKKAQEYANILAKSGEFVHDIDNNHDRDDGENLYASSENRPLNINDAMYHWFEEEEPLYDYNTGNCKEAYYPNGNRIKCGHYTQVIWQDSREVGCATAQYKTGRLKDGYVYVCKYHRAGNLSLNGVSLKPYCSTYDKSDIYDIGAIPKRIVLVNKKFPIELVVEDRVKCTRKDNFNSAIEFSSDLKSAIVRDFQIFNNGKYPNTLEFNSISVDGATIIMRGVNKNIVDKKYKNKPIFMKFTLLGESEDYYAVDLQWNGLDENKPEYSRDMKAKLYKDL
jgi:hypothetical protein